MPYDDKKLYKPIDREQNRIDLLARYNDYLRNVEESHLDIPFNDWQGSNIYFVFDFFMQELERYDVTVGLLQQAIINFLATRNKEILSVLKSSVDGVTNALATVEEIEQAFIYEPNLVNLPTPAGTFEPVLLLKEGVDNTDVDLKNRIAEVLLESSGVGNHSVGDVVVQTTSLYGVTSRGFTFAERLDLKIKLRFDGDSIYGGLPLTETEVKNIFIKQFNLRYKLGKDLNTRQYTALSDYQGLSFLDCEVSLNGGATYKPVNSIIKVNSDPLFNKKTFCVVKIENIEAVKIDV